MFRMNTRVLYEYVIFVELLLLIVITWPVLEFAINKIEFRYDLVFIPCTVLPHMISMLLTGAFIKA